MRILHLLASPFFSGPAEAVAGLARAQAALGHEVTVAVDRLRTGVAAEEPAAPRLEALGLLDDGGLELSVKSRPWRVARDLSRLRKRQVDVVHAHFTHDHLLARFGRPAGAVLVRSLHAPRSLRRSLPRADAYTVPDGALLRRLVGRRARVLPPLVDARFVPAPDVAALRARLGLPVGARLVGMVSTFQRSRRHALGVEAFARLRAQRPDAHLVLVGDGALLPEVLTQVEAAGLAPHVTFAGYKGGDAFVPWLQALDEAWVLGLGNDWAGRAAAQARACGVRVVAADEGALGSWADVVLPEPAADALVRAALSDERAERAVPAPEDVARGVLALYAEAREGTP